MSEEMSPLNKSITELPLIRSCYTLRSVYSKSCWKCISFCEGQSLSCLTQVIIYVLSTSQARYKRGFSYSLISSASTDACSLVFITRKVAFLRLRYAGNFFDMFYLNFFFARVLESQDSCILNHAAKECEPQWLTVLCDSVTSVHFGGI